jgi:hypothetical protein
VAGYEQAGVYEICTGNATTSYNAGFSQGGAFSDSQPSTSFAVNPGDAIFASVFYNSSQKNYTYNVTDESSGQELNIKQACPANAGCSNDSATVAASDSQENVYSFFTLVQFAAIKVTDSAGQGGGLKDAHWETISGVSGSPDEEPPGLGPLYSSTSPALSAFQLCSNGCD